MLTGAEKRRILKGYSLHRITHSSHPILAQAQTLEFTINSAKVDRPKSACNTWGERCVALVDMQLLVCSINGIVILKVGV